jgi:hypothetical protein
MSDLGAPVAPRHAAAGQASEARDWRDNLSFDLAGHLRKGSRVMALQITARQLSISDVLLKAGGLAAAVIVIRIVVALLPLPACH